MNPQRLLRPLRLLRRRVLLHRRPLAAVTAAAAALAALQATSPPAPETVSVLTARRDLPSGTVVQRSDLVTAVVAAAAVPTAGVRDAEAVVGRTLAAPMARGEMLTAVRTVGAGLLRGYPGMTAVPLRITDAAVVELLRVGDQVSFVVADPDGRAAPEVLLEDVAVVAIPRSEEGALSGGTPGRLVVVAVPSSRASDVAARAATSILIPVWSG
jgi:Flp pilus assembly protein CpaB